MAEFAICRVQGTEAMGGGISSRAVAAHADLPTAESNVVVVELAKLGTHEAMNIGERFLAMSDTVSGAATVKRRVFVIMECATPVLGGERRRPQRQIIGVQVSGHDREDKFPGVGTGELRIKLFSEGS